MKTYLIQRGDEQRGPYSLAQLEHMWRSGALTVDSYYWTEGMVQWAPVSDLLEPVAVPLKEDTASPRPPPLPVGQGTTVHGAAAASPTKPVAKSVNFWFPDIDSREDALLVIRRTTWLYVVVIALNLLFAAMGEPAFFFTAVVVAACAVFLRTRHSRVAAVLLLALSNSSLPSRPQKLPSS
jgi:hypothetical protein